LGAREGEAWDNLGLAYQFQGKGEQALFAFQRAAVARARPHTGARQSRQRPLHPLRMGRLEAYEQRLIATLDDPASDPRWPPWIALSLPTSSRTAARGCTPLVEGDVAGGRRRGVPVRRAQGVSASAISPAISAIIQPGA